VYKPDFFVRHNNKTDYKQLLLQLVNMIIRLFALLSIVFILGLSSCKKNNDAPVSTKRDSLMMINASADTVNLYLNGTRLNNNSNLAPGISTIYYSIPFGAQAFQVKKKFNPITGVVQPLFTMTYPTDGYQYHSLFVVDETQANAFFTVDTLAFVADTGICYVRFVNASIDAGNLDFTANSTKFSNQAFKKGSGFKQVAVSSNTDTLATINVYHEGQTTPIISGKYSLIPGYVYTFWTQGKLNGTGNLIFSVGATTNAIISN
jgi:Domain of unknown function (DUF4397)